MGEKFKTKQCSLCGAVCEVIFVKKKAVLVNMEPYKLRPNEEGREVWRDFGVTKDGRFFKGKITNPEFLQPDVKYADVYKLHNCRRVYRPEKRAMTYIR